MQRTNPRPKLLVDPGTAPVVRDVFQWFVRDGMSKAGVVKKLIELGVPCPAAYKHKNGMNYQNPSLKGEPLWSAQTVTHMLQNQMYLGHMVQGKQRVKSYKVHTRVSVLEDEWFIKADTHEPIVDTELFAQAQRLLQRDTRTAPNSTKPYLFSGFLRCADCGKAMARRTSKDRVYYACRTYTTSGSLCSRLPIRHDKLEQLVLTALQHEIDRVDGLAELIDEINTAPVVRTTSKRLDSTLKQRRQELERAASIRTDLFLDWKNGDISREEYHSLKRKLEEKGAALGQEIARLEAEICGAAQGVTASDPFFEAFRKYKNTTALNRGIVAELIQAIHIHEGGDVDIDLNFADQHRRAAEFIESNQRPPAQEERQGAFYWGRACRIMGPAVGPVAPPPPALGGQQNAGGGGGQQGNIGLPGG
jgi:uncharacterized small protein (DUF1192 family)